MLRPAPSFVSLLALALAACGSAPAGVHPDVECAAQISTSTYLHVRGAITLGDADYRAALGGLMVYATRYGVRNDVSEADVFAAITARREALLETASPAAVKRRALCCLRRAPKY